MSRPFASGGPSFEALASASVLPVNSQGWFPLGLTGLILQSKGLSRVFFSTTVQKHQFFGPDSIMVQLSHLYMVTGKTIALTTWTFVSQVMALPFNTLSRFALIWPTYTSSFTLQNSSYKFGSRYSKLPTASPSQDHIRLLDAVFVITSLSGELLFILSDSLKKSFYQASPAHYPLFVFPWFTICLFTVAFILSCFNFLWYFFLH